MDLGPVADAAQGFSFNLTSGNTFGPLWTIKTAVLYGWRDWVTAEADSRVLSVMFGAAGFRVASVADPFCSRPRNCFHSTAETRRELTSGRASFYLRVRIIFRHEERFLLYSCRRKDEVKTLMLEKKTEDFHPWVGKMRHTDRREMLSS